jgi:hypothetical protein
MPHKLLISKLARRVPDKTQSVSARNREARLRFLRSADGVPLVRGATL